MNWIVLSSAALVVLIGAAKFLAISVWVQAKAVNLPLGLAEIIGMRMRRVDPAAVVVPAIAAKAMCRPIDIVVLETHLLAGGRVDRLVKAVIEAKTIGLDVSVDDIAKADLDGRDPIDWVRARANRSLR